MRYVIIGAGAVGGTIGGRLFHAGHEVLLVARGAHYEAMRDRGLTLRTPDETLSLAVPVADSASGGVRLRAGDVLVLATKTQDTAGALEAALTWPVDGADVADLPVVCAQNGVENERIALRRFARVYAMLVWLPATHMDPGEVAASGTPLSGILDLGRYPSGTDELAETIAADLSGSGFAAVARTDTLRWKYGKLRMNLVNALGAVCARGDGWNDLADRVREEGVAALDAAGIAYTTSTEEKARRGDLVQSGRIAGADRSGSSSWQSLARATGSIEADYLNGEIALLGRTYGVPTPVNDALQRAARRSAAERRPPASMTVADITALLP
ncbi:MAG TPA: 2-dehydropantoate 2-reductase N-terminal domain-containing protein [Streptosporangiaceae bacterium]|jgi:2-dehydropantoate 2-reductase